MKVTSTFVTSFLFSLIQFVSIQCKRYGEVKMISFVESYKKKKIEVKVRYERLMSKSALIALITGYQKETAAII